MKLFDTFNCYYNEGTFTSEVINEKNFIEIYDLYKDDIFRLAYSYTKCIPDAEDIVQEVFVKLYKNINNFEDINHIKKWCIKVTVNSCKNLFLSSWKKKKFFLTDKNENLYGANYLFDKNEVLDILLKLPKKQRLIIYLYYYEGYKINEISEILKTNKSTIKTNLFRGRDKLKNILKEE